jgi:hypothetical protein
MRDDLPTGAPQMSAITVGAPSAFAALRKKKKPEEEEEPDAPEPVEEEPEP